MMHAAADPLAAATSIARAARHRADAQEHPCGVAAVVALGAGVILSLAAMATMVASPAAIPLWCAAHGGCP